MLDAGFENDIRRIIAHCPDKTAGRQTVMCTFTRLIIDHIVTDHRPLSSELRLTF